MKRVRGSLILLLCALPLLAADTNSDKAAKIDKFVSVYADYGLFSGTVLVSEHDRVIFKEGYGLANREWNIPNTPDVKFRIGSITKQFTSMLVMQQVAKGTIKLDAHIPDYLPYYRKDTGNKVTIHHLLTHTSGIPSYTDDPKFMDEVARNPYQPDDFVKKYCSGDLQYDPGSKFHYNNSGYFLLGAILEHVTGKKYEQLLKENIFDPLGMKDTGYDHSSEILSKRATGYENGLGEVGNSDYLDMSLPYAAGSLYSTVEDMYKWDQALYSDKLLPAALKEKMWTPGLEKYGYGWFIDKIPAGEPAAGKTMIAHGGGINGFNTTEQRLVDDHDLIVAFNNTPGANLGEMATGIRAILYGAEPKPVKRSLVSTLGSTIVHKGVDAAIAQYRDLKRTDPDGYDFAPPRLNLLGRMLLAKDRAGDAIAIFKLNAEEYPKNPGAYNGLGDAYAKAGKKDLAVESYRKAIELNPQDQAGKDKLKALEAK
jgi:CubicO group peptidase (beta-lactamase class C family)